MSGSRILVLALLLGGAVLSYILSRDVETDRSEQLAPNPAHEGYYIRDAVIQGIGSDGRFLYSLAADDVTEDADSAGARLENVVMSYATDENIGWTLSAQSGVVSEDGSRVRFTGNVVAAANIDGIETALETEVLELLPRSYELRSDERITLRVGSRTLSATGVLAFLNEDRVEFLSNVSGKFQP